MIGIICGMASEARCITRAPCAEQFTVRVSGASAARARDHAADLAAGGARALISFGLSGALDPECVPGELLLVVKTVLPNGNAIATDSLLFRKLSERIANLEAAFGPLPPRTATIVGSEYVIGSGEAKQSLRRRTEAMAVDMESHAVASVAHGCGIAYAAIRAIADPADRAIPQTAMAGLAPDGTTRPLRVIRELMARPQDLPALLQLGRDARAGLTALRGAALHLLPAL